MSIYKEIKERADKKGIISYKRDGYKHEINYADFFNLVDKIASSLLESGIRKGSKVGVYLPTSPEWIAIDLACFKIGAISIPISSKFRKEKLREFLNIVELDMIFSFQDYYFLKKKIIIKNISDIESNFRHFIKEGVLFKPNYDITEDDVATICYTSGSTGNPKGVMLTHGNILFNLKIFPFEINEKDLFMHYLPLEHIFGRTCGIYSAMYNNSSIFILEDTNQIFIEIFENKPTIVMTVPLVLERFYKNLISDEVFNSLIKQGSYNPIIKNLKSKFGDRFRFFLCGGAPLDRELNLKLCKLGLQCYEGYGLTETAPLISANSIEQNLPGSVGKPINEIKVKISDRGTLLVKSPGLMKGYTDKEKTKEVIIDGWFDTNDLVKIDEKGFIKILGRADDLIVLSNGKKVFPERIEKEIEYKGIDQAIVLRSEGNNLIALIYSDKSKSEVGEIIQIYNNECPGFEKIQDYVLLPEEMTIDNDMLTVVSVYYLTL